MFKRNQRKSDTDLRARRSLDAIRALSQARSSEQIPRQHPPLPDPATITAAVAANQRPQSSAEQDTQIKINIENPPPTPPQAKPNPRSVLSRFRNASDSALALKVRDHNPPPIPSHTQDPPAIITTDPANDVIDMSNFHQPRRSNTMRLWRKKEERPQTSATSISQRSSLSTKRSQLSSRNGSMLRLGRTTFDQPARLEAPSTSSLLAEPPAYDEHGSSLPLPHPRLSESSRSTASSGDQTIAYHTTTTTTTQTTTTTFFRLPRRRKKDTPLFPLPDRPSDRPSSDVSSTPRSDRGQSLRRHSMISVRSASMSPSISGYEKPTTAALAAASIGMFGPGTPVLRSNSITSAISGHSSNGTPGSPVQRADSIRRTRGRSSTLSSLENGGRNSLGNSFLNRIRRESDSARSASPQPHLAFSAPASGKASREIFIPERNDTDTPPIYLSKLLEALSKSVVASLLARNGDPFHLAVLKSYMETFQFADDPMDMALRKLLMEVELPSETQQIDRVLQAFADRYHECNPFIYKDSDQAYYIAFSLIMLHTDFFNRNNKHKMQKADYVKNTSRAIDKEGISTDILECFYANIIYTPFIRLEDEFDINGQKIVPHRPKKNFFHRAVTHNDGKRIKEPVDPYLLIIENQLDLLRASLKDVVQFEDPYSYSGTASRLDMGALHKAFFRSGVLQIVSARSRPDAFMTQQSMENPDGADPGVVEIKVTKVGLLWRKEVKRKKTRSPWQEWGAVLTGSQLYFFRNIAWVKSLINQYETHHKQGTGTPVVFKPPLEQFKPDAQISTDDAVALLDKSYKKHKNAFAFIRHGGIQEYFIADSEADMNDWLAKLNYAATFRTAGVRMRGVVGGNYDGQRARGMRRMEGTGNPNASSVITPTGEVSIVRGGIDVKLAAEIAAARREVVEQRIFDSEDKIAQANKELQTCLRNGRHLTILTPIQPRTREQVVMAAATLAAKLQWVRMEMWKLRCHRDILALDLEEERKSTKEQAKRIAAESSLGTTAGPSLLPRSPAPSRPTTPAAPVSESSTSGIGSSSGTGGLTPTQEHFNPNDNLSQTTSQTASQSSQHKRGNSADQSITSERLGRESALSAPHRSPSSSSARVMRDDRSIGTGNSHRSVSPARSLSSVTSVEHGDSDSEGETIGTTSGAPGGGIGSTKGQGQGQGQGQGTDGWTGGGEGWAAGTTGQQGSAKSSSGSKKDKSSKTKDKESRVRRGLQRTLRETEKLGHRRGKSGDVTGEEKKKEDEGLPRVPGSFTVHGKKASVITFGSEWTAITAEERLKQRMKVPEDGAQGLHAQVDGEDTERAVFTRKGSSAAVMQVRKEDEIAGEKREFPEVSLSSETQARSEMKFETKVEERDSSSSSSSIVTAAPVIASSEDL